MGPGVSFECYEAQTGLHINEDHFLAEIIDPDTGEPLADGEIGRAGVHHPHQRRASPCCATARAT